MGPWGWLLAGPQKTGLKRYNHWPHIHISWERKLIRGQKSSRAAVFPVTFPPPDRPLHALLPFATVLQRGKQTQGVN